MQIAIFGGGPAGLFAAQLLAEAGCLVTLYDRMPTPGRKFLLAGRGGLNLTHSEPIGQLLLRYGEPSAITRSVEAFPPSALRAWADELGAHTFVGTSGRVFPQVLRATPLLRAWLGRLSELGVTFVTKATWKGFGADGEHLVSEERNGKAVERRIAADAAVLALGGASWPRLGSNGSWVGAVVAAGIQVTALEAANSGLCIDWSDRVKVFRGQPLKNIALRCHDVTVYGEIMIDARGIEGGAVYAIGRQARTWLHSGECVLQLDMRADLSVEGLATRLSKARGKQSMSTWLGKAAGLTPAAIAILRDTNHGAALPADPFALASHIKSVPLRITASFAIDRAISTAGGIALSELSDAFELRKQPHTYAIGEMLDWEAPTGGYLLQACFATAAAASASILSC